jgi:hypothetical protein
MPKRTEDMLEQSSFTIPLLTKWVMNRKTTQPHSITEMVYLPSLFVGVRSMQETL